MQSLCECFFLARSKKKKEMSESEQNNVMSIDFQWSRDRRRTTLDPLNVEEQSKVSQSNTVVVRLVVEILLQKEEYKKSGRFRGPKATKTTTTTITSMNSFCKRFI